MARLSSGHWHGSSNQRSSTKSRARLTNSTASATVQAWLASTRKRTPGRAVLTARARRSASSAGEPADLELHPDEALVGEKAHLLFQAGRVVGVVAADADHRQGVAEAPP